MTKAQFDRKPDWLKVRAPGGPRYAHIKERRESLGLATVCEEARCPNMGECWGHGTATFMVLGPICTRGCRFCAVTTKKQGLPIDPQEPTKLADTVASMGLDYVVLTMVDRDDLDDGGADHVAACVEAINQARPQVRVEVLTGDFGGDREAIERVANSGAAVMAHNIETVRSLTNKVRDGRCGYDQSLDVLRLFDALAAPSTPIKSSIMVGLGETDEEVLETLTDLRAAHCTVVTIGQYLRPSAKHLPVVEYIHPEQFRRWEERALEMGFDACFSGPLVRSSYRAAEVFLAQKTGVGTARSRLPVLG